MSKPKFLKVIFEVENERYPHLGERNWLPNKEY